VQHTYIKTCRNTAAQYTATHCNTLQHTYIKNCRNTAAQYTATHCNTLQHTYIKTCRNTAAQYTANLAATQKTATHTFSMHCNTPTIGLAEKCIAVCERVCCSVLQTLSHTATHLYQALSKRTATHCNTLQHTPTHLNTPAIHLQYTCNTPATGLPKRVL